MVTMVVQQQRIGGGVVLCDMCTPRVRACACASADACGQALPPMRWTRRRCSPSCHVPMSQGAGNALSVLLFTMLNTMLKAYLAEGPRGAARGWGFCKGFEGRTACRAVSWLVRCIGRRAMQYAAGVSRMSAMHCGVAPTL